MLIFSRCFVPSISRTVSEVFIVLLTYICVMGHLQKPVEYTSNLSHFDICELKKICNRSRSKKDWTSPTRTVKAQQSSSNYLLHQRRGDSMWIAVLIDLFLIRKRKHWSISGADGSIIILLITYETNSLYVCKLFSLDDQDQQQQSDQQHQQPQNVMCLASMTPPPVCCLLIKPHAKVLSFLTNWLIIELLFAKITTVRSWTFCVHSYYLDIFEATLSMKTGKLLKITCDVYFIIKDS